jgi:hypothetical protein
MSTATMLRLVRDVQRGRLSDAQRDALAQLLLATYVAVELDDDPDQEWRPVIAALRELITPVRPRDGNVVALRPCSGRGR